MEPRLIVFFILTPFVLIFLYASWHEYQRYKYKGASSYGLTYDPESNTTSVGPLPEDEDGFDLEDFNPEDTPAPDETAAASLDTDPKEQDKTS